MKTIDFGGGILTLASLERILNILNADGEITIKNVSNGTVGSLVLGAQLMALAQGVNNVAQQV